jgi:hypothetical protein
VDQAAAAVAVVAFIASELEAGHEPDVQVLNELLRDTVVEGVAHLAAAIVWQVPGARDELARLGLRLASCSEEAR